MTFIGFGGLIGLVLILIYFGSRDPVPKPEMSPKRRQRITLLSGTGLVGLSFIFTYFHTDTDIDFWIMFGLTSLAFLSVLIVSMYFSHSKYNYIFFILISVLWFFTLYLGTQRLLTNVGMVAVAPLIGSLLGFAQRHQYRKLMVVSMAIFVFVMVSVFSTSFEFLKLNKIDYVGSEYLIEHVENAKVIRRLYVSGNRGEVVEIRTFYQDSSGVLRDYILTYDKGEITSMVIE